MKRSSKRQLGVAAFAVLAAIAAPACNALVDLSEPSNGSDSGATRDASQPVADSSASSGGTLTPPGTDGGPGGPASPTSTSPPLAATGTVVAAVIAGNSLYAVVGGRLVRVMPSSDVWAGIDGAAPVSSLAIDSASVYVGTSDGIVSFALDGGLEAPAVVVDDSLAFPDASTGVVAGLASDGESVYFTQRIAGAFALVRHDLAAPSSAATVLFSAAPSDALNLVAVDETHAFTIGTDLGNVYAIAKGGDDAGASTIASGAMASSSIQTLNGAVYFLAGAPYATMGTLMELPMANPVSTALYQVSASAFVVFDSGIYFGHSEAIMSATSVGQDVTRLTTTSQPQIAGIAFDGRTLVWWGGAVLSLTLPQ